MTRGAFAAAALLLAALAGCSGFEPFETLPAPPTGATDTRMRVGLCYDGLVSAPEAVQKAAQSSCPAHTTAQRVDTDYRVQLCPLLLPAHATYVCAPGH